MKIAVPCENELGLESMLAEHFGRARYFAIVDVEDNRIRAVEVAEAPLSHSPGELPTMLKEKGVELVLAYGMGIRAVEFFESYGIKVVTRARGKVIEVVKSFLDGKLQIEENWMKREDFRKHSQE